MNDDTIEVDRARFRIPDWLRAVQARTFAALREIAGSFTPGMLEAEALALTSRPPGGARLREELAPPLCPLRPQHLVDSYGKPSLPDTRLRDEDIFFLDIGPVLDGVRRRRGRHLRGRRRRAAAALRRGRRALWRKTRDAWRERNLSGPALYAAAQESAAALGWTLNPEWAGHRISEFPHHAHTRVRWPARRAARRRDSGSSRSTSAIRRARSAPSMRTCCPDPSRTPRSTRAHLHASGPARGEVFAKVLAICRVELVGAGGFRTLDPCRVKAVLYR